MRDTDAIPAGYRQDVQDHAANILNLVKTMSASDRADVDVDDMISEECDGALAYTSDQLECLRETQNDDAWVEHTDLSGCTTTNAVLTIITEYALRADVKEALDRMVRGSVYCPCDWFEEEDDEEEEDDDLDDDEDEDD